MTTLVRYRAALERGFGTVDHLIVFGSAATGRGTPDSDVDVVVVSGGFVGLDPLERMARARLLWPRAGPLDVLCYTPQEFNRLARRVSIVSVAVAEGVEIAAA